MTTEGGVEGLFHILRSYLIRDFKDTIQDKQACSPLSIMELST